MSLKLSNKLYDSKTYHYTIHRLLKVLIRSSKSQYHKLLLNINHFSIMDYAKVSIMSHIPKPISMARNCGCTGYVSDNFVDDPCNAPRMAKPCDLHHPLHGSLPSSGAHLLLCSPLQGQSGRMGSSRHCCCLSPHHVCLALRHSEALRI